MCVLELEFVDVVSISCLYLLWEGEDMFCCLNNDSFSGCSLKTALR